jgi:uncharacterized membrane protein HdeD (DUF308 family)
MADSHIADHFERTTFYQPWWLTLFRGVVILIFGIFATIWPVQTITFLVRLLGIYFFVDGIFILFMSITNRKHDLRWQITLARGIVGTVAGAVIIFVPFFTAATIGIVLMYILAVISLYHGVMDILKAIRARREIKDEWVLVLSGIFFVALAALLFVAPYKFGEVVIRIIGIVAIVSGAGFLIFAFMTKRQLSK